MLTIAYYFLQVVLCSGLLMGYYWLVLRNKRFHQYNRFFLLAAAILSWIVPLIKITWVRPLAQSETPPVMNILSVVADNNSQIESTITQKAFVWNWDLLASILYIAVAAVLLLSTVHAFVKLYRLLKQHSCKNVGDVFLILTHAKGTPFSFFRYIFWNEEIDIRSEAGQQILKHELTHVQQKHSFDKLFIQLMLIGGWFNPFFWVLKREMEMIHEFIADKKAVNNGDTAALAQMLLTAAYPQQKFTLTHPFFFSPIKRRLLMLTNNKNPRFSYIRRMVVLPLLAVVIVLFAFRSKEQRINGEISIASVVENYKEEIKDVFTKDEPAPDDFVLVNGKKIAAETIDIKELISAPYTMGLTQEKQLSEGKSLVNAVPLSSIVSDPIFVVNGQKVSKETLAKFEPNTIKSIQVYKGSQAVELFGPEGANGVISIVLKTVTGNISDNDEIFSFPMLSGIAKDTYNNIAKNRKVYANIIIYQGEEKTRVFEETTETRCDENGNFSVKIGTGTKDATSKDLSQIDLSRGPFYANLKVAVAPSVSAAWWVPGENLVDLGFSKITVKDNRPDAAIPPPSNFSGTFLQTMPNGDIKWTTTDGRKLISTPTTKTVDGKELISFNTRPDTENATSQENDPLKEVVVIGYGTKNNVNTKKSGQPARFPGGDAAWDKYLQHSLNRDILKNSKAAFGKYTVVVSFIVEKDGSIRDVHAQNDPGYGTKAEAERIILKGPKWVPATNEKGDFISFRQMQPVSFMYVDGNTTPDMESSSLEKVSVKATNVKREDVSIAAISVPANVVTLPSGTLAGGVFSGTFDPSIGTLPSFPGGAAAWTKYLERNTNTSELVSKGAPAGKYTVVLSFVVESDGSIKDIHADTDPGYGAKEQAMRIISKGPAWVPANVRGKAIASRHRVSVTFNVE